jgi:hypothetical protein
MPAAIAAPEKAKSAALDKKALAAAKLAAKTKLAPVAVLAEPAPILMGSVQIAVSPWGEIFVDGASKGIAPPLTKLTLTAGKHKIEIKNGDENYAVTVDVNPEKEAKIGHRF